MGLLLHVLWGKDDHVITRVYCNLIPQFLNITAELAIHCLKFGSMNNQRNARFNEGSA